jgi:uncharacterized damage-inducible protein DinB
MSNIFKMFIILCLVTIPALAQEKSAEPVVADFLNVYNFTTGKFAQLAGEFPEDKSDWRPAEGIRSVKEVVLHATAGNYFFGSYFGAAPPEGIDPRTLEKSDMSQEQAVAAFKASLSVVQGALNNLTKEQLEEKIDFFGNKITKRQTVLSLGDHAAEHLGQLIAYARSNGVVPPWSKKN